MHYSWYRVSGIYTTCGSGRCPKRVEIMQYLCEAAGEETALL